MIPLRSTTLLIAAGLALPVALAAPAQGAAPACGSPASLQAGSPYSGTISRPADKVTIPIRTLSFGPANFNEGGILLSGNVTFKADFRGKTVTDNGNVRWVSSRGFVFKPYNSFAVKVFGDNGKDWEDIGGSYECDPATGAVQSLTAQDVQYVATYNEPAETRYDAYSYGNGVQVGTYSGGYRSYGTLTLTSKSTGKYNQF